MSRRANEDRLAPAARGRAWARYRAAAARGVAVRAVAPDGDALGLMRSWFSALWASAGDPVPLPSRSRFRDLRLVPVGAAAWVGTAVAPFLGNGQPGTEAWATGPAQAVGWLLAMGVVAAGVGFSARCLALRAAVVAGAVLLALAAGIVAGTAHTAAERAGPVGELLAAGGQTIAVAQVESDPRPQRASGRFQSGPRFLADARLLQATAGGLEFTASASVLLAGGADVAELRAGQRIRLAGTVVPSSERTGSALVSVRSRPQLLGTDPALSLASRARATLRETAGWLSPEAAGLVSGLTVGDTGRMPVELDQDMREVGLGHLTAVSGANFTMLLGTVLLSLRALRAPRWAALTGCGLALLSFAAVVGPEPSVLRAAVMGAVGLVALATGRAGRSCSALSAAVLVLVLVDPTLGSSMGFLLSVAATLGIIVLGPPLAGVLAARLPLWLAMAVAVPLSAQLMCGPIMVLIQPAFLSFSLLANVVVAPLVPVITVAGTLALAGAPLLPPLGTAATAVGGAGAELLAAVATGLAAVPGAALPWPEGLVGAAAMAGLSALNATALWAGLLPSGRARVRGLLRHTADAVRGAARRVLLMAARIGSRGEPWQSCRVIRKAVDMMQSPSAQERP
jgi:competence protein ComEC